MGFLVDGTWHGGDDRQIGAQGWEPREEVFTDTIKPGGTFPPEAGRYHLVVCPGCPLSHRVAMAHRLKKLDGIIGTTIVRPVMGFDGREFGSPDGVAADPVLRRHLLRDVYTDTRPNYSGRASTPVLWDSKTRTIVSNAYRVVLATINRAFNAFAGSSIDLQPPDLTQEREAELSWLSANLDGVVYKAGFSRDQADYEAHEARVDAALPALSTKLSQRPFLLGEAPTEPDIALFACLARFDAIYVPLFRCTRQRVEDHPALVQFMRRMLGLPGIADTFDLQATMMHYFLSHLHLSPTRVVPRPPRLSWLPPQPASLRPAQAAQ